MLLNPRRAIVEFRQLTPSELRELANRAATVISYIRHQSTVEAISSIIKLETNAGNYVYRPGDTIVMITLKVPVRGQEVQVRPEDLVIYLVSVYHIE
jgi:hypothetical protein